MSSTADKVVGSITSPPRIERVVSKLDGVGKEVEEAAEQAKRFSAHALFSGRMLLADTKLEKEAKVMAKRDSFMFGLRGCLVSLDPINKIGFYCCLGSCRWKKAFSLCNLKKSEIHSSDWRRWKAAARRDAVQPLIFNWVIFKIQRHKQPTNFNFTLSNFESCWTFSKITHPNHCMNRYIEYRTQYETSSKCS